VNSRIATVLGVLFGVVGIAALAVPGLTAVLPTDDLAVALLGGVLVLGGLRELYRRRNTERTYAETDETERAIELPTPGEDFDERLDRLSTIVYQANERQQLREEVGRAAVATLQRRFEYTEGEANEAIRAGTWTDDPFAASFLNGRPPAVGRAERVREFVRSGTVFQQRARRAVDEIYRLAEGEGGETDAGD
jgi:hypothetical protein